MKTSELTGALLDYYVAKARNKIINPESLTSPHGCEVRPALYGRNVALPEYESYHPSQNWELGGPIVEREKIAIEFHPSLGWRACVDNTFSGDESPDPYSSGPTPLIAAMRAYVASKFGEEVPDA